MSYISLGFYVFLAGLALLYYLLPMKARWGALLFGNVVFLLSLHPSKRAALLFVLSVLVCYAFGVALEKRKAANRKNQALLIFAIFLSAAPLLLLKIGKMLGPHLSAGGFQGWIVPVGLSFYTLEMISYLVDICQNKITAQKNLLKFSLYISFFPKIIQGPISRYEEVSSQLFGGNRFQKENLLRAFQLVLWGFFLKLMIADKAAVFVNTMFAEYESYRGWQLWVGAILYSIQLYTDFLSCTTLSRGAALLFGIRLQHNFATPYFSVSIKEFWHNWHMTLSRWLRDYIYIPLGGNKKGKFRKYLNLLITFFISGLWHGDSLRFLVWGLMHGIYQIFGDMTFKIREKIYRFLDMPKGSFGYKLFKSVNTFLLVTLAWVMFRADSLTVGIRMIRSMFLLDNPWTLFDDSLLALGLGWKEFLVLILSVLTLIAVGIIQKKHSVTGWLAKQSTVVQCLIYGGVIFVIFVFGTYGLTFNASDFIYGGF